MSGIANCLGMALYSMEPATEPQTAHSACQVEHESDLVGYGRWCGQGVRGEWEMGWEEVKRDQGCKEQCADGVGMDADRLVMDI